MTLFDRSKLHIAAGAIAILFCAMQSGQALEDKIILRGKPEPKLGKVKSADLTNIEMELKGGNGASESFKPEQIESIEWDVGSRDFKEGVAAYKSGNFRSSASRFAEIISNKEEMDSFRTEAKPYLYFVCADSLYKAGNLKEAVPAFEKFVTDFPNSMYVSLSIANTVDAAIRTQEFGKVPALLEKLRGQGSEQKAMSDYYGGQMLQAQGKIPEAEKKYNDAANASSVNETKAIAIMGLADCAIKANNMTKAGDEAKRALALFSAPPPNVAGLAHLINGNVYKAQAASATGQKQMELLTDAILEYMRNDVQYQVAPAVQGESMLNAAECLEILAKTFAESHGGDVGRAMTLYGKLASDSRYRGSRFQAKANECLDRLKK
jgi:tetratricopeptide (TPR) repeat protein